MLACSTCGPSVLVVNLAVLRLRGSICHKRGYFFTNARKIYYHLHVSIARFLKSLSQVTQTLNS